MMDFQDMEEEIARSEAATLQARVIVQQGRDILRSIAAMDNGVPTARSLRTQKQRVSKLITLFSSGNLAASLREPVGVEHLRLMEFYNSVVRPQDSMESSHETQEEVERDSVSDINDTDSHREDGSDCDIVMESSSDEENEPEDVSDENDTDSDSEDITESEDDSDSVIVIESSSEEDNEPQE